MCSVNAIKLIVMILSYLKVVFMLYVFAIGCYFASSSDFQQAFGTQFIEYGLSLIFLALLSLALIYPFKYGVNRHNRFIMIFTFIFETVVFAELINYSTILSSYTVSEFDQSLQLDCLRAKPEIYTKEECEPFLKSDRTAGFRLVWSSYFTKREQKIPYQILTRIQEQDCCGFFAPIRCAANNDSFPSNRETKGISSALLERRVTCSIHDPTYYPEQSDCQDGPEFPDIVLGCKYDLGVGFCLGKNVIDETKGCAYYMELYVNGLINPHTPTLIVCACFNFFYMLLACCMWWKRKHTDVFPTFSGGKKHTIKYKDVKHQFEVDPHPNLLTEEGFLPVDSTEEKDSTLEDTQIELAVRSKPGTANNETNNNLEQEKVNTHEPEEQV